MNDPFFGAFETRLLVFLEDSDYDGFRQVYLTQEQFKKVSDAIIRESIPDKDRPGMETVRIEMSTTKIEAKPFEGMNSINDDEVV